MDNTDATRSGAHRLRASDTEREQVAAILRAAMAEGRLTLEEGETRLGTVYAATFRDELSPVTADLPDGGRPALTDTPDDRAAARQGLRRHLGFVAVIAVLLTGIWALSGAHIFWPAIPLAFLVMGMVRHARWRHWPPEHPYRHQGRPWSVPDHR